MMPRTVIVHHPIPSDLRQLLDDGGYIETSIHDGYSIYSQSRVPSVPPDRRAAVDKGSKPDKVLLTPEEAGRALSLGRTKVYQLISSGALRSIRVGKSRRIPRAALVELVDHLQAG